MNIYIAGSSNELDRAELWIARAKTAGWTVTLDWTIPIREKGSGNDLPFVEKRMYARADREAIFNADAFWFLVPRETMSFGAAWEFGLAHSLRWYGGRYTPPSRKVLGPEGEILGYSDFGTAAARLNHVVLSGPKSGDHIFTTLADMAFPRDEDAFEYLLRAS